MTYGWMLLVVSVVGGAIFATVTDQSLKNISGFAGNDVSLEDIAMTSQGLSGVFRNRAGEEITISDLVLHEGGEKVVIYPNEEIDVGDKEVIRFPVFESGDGSGSVDLEIRYDISGLTDLGVNGTITGNYDLRKSYSPKEWRTEKFDPEGSGYHPYTWGPEEKPEVDWMAKNRSNYRSNPSLSEDVLYQTSRVGNPVKEVMITAFDAQDGSIIWEFNVSDEGIGTPTPDKDANKGQGVSIYDNPEVTDERIIFWRRNNTLFALDKENGNLEWTAQGQFNTHKDGVIYTAAGWHGEPININPAGERPLPESKKFDDYVRAFDEEDGTMIWEYEADFTGTGERADVVSEEEDKRWIYRDGGISHNPAVDEDNVYVSGKGHVFALDQETGNEIWRTEIESGVRSKPAVDNERLYVSSLDGWNINSSNTVNPSHLNSTFWVLDKDNGDILWSKRTADRRALSGPALYDDKVYHAAPNKSVNNVTVHAFDQETGNEVWSTNFDWNDVWGSSFIADGVLYQMGDIAKDEESNMKALDAESGEVLWEKQVGEDARSTPVIGEGRLYVSARNQTTDNNNLWALEAP